MTRLAAERLVASYSGFGAETHLMSCKFARRLEFVQSVCDIRTPIAS